MHGDGCERYKRERWLVMRIDLLTLHQDEGLEIALDDYGKVTIRWRV
jgi:hypothetical protein